MKKNSTRNLPLLTHRPSQVVEWENDFDDKFFFPQFTMKRQVQYFANGFKPRPYTIYLLGPCQDTCETFLVSLRNYISTDSGNTGDTIDTSREDPSVPVISNAFTCIYKARSAIECDITFTLTWDFTILEYKGSIPSLPQIDAFILLFRVENQTDFSAIRTRHVPRLIAISEQHFDGIEKVLFIVAHRSNVFSSQQGFAADEMKTLVSISHSTYRYANITQGKSCCDIIDLVILQLNDVHSKRYFELTRCSSSRSVDSNPSILSKLLSIIPHCGVSKYTQEEPSRGDTQFRSYGTNK